MQYPRLFALLSLLTVAGCHSPYVQATVYNRTSEPLQLIEVDYPSASFGTQALGPGQDYHYRFKVLGEGKMKLTYTDITKHEHKSDGPNLKEGAEGPLTITIAADGAHWQASPTVSNAR
jgi:hypothetical protein